MKKNYSLIIYNIQFLPKTLWITKQENSNNADQIRNSNYLNILEYIIDIGIWEIGIHIILKQTLFYPSTVIEFIFQEI